MKKYIHTYAKVSDLSNVRRNRVKKVIELLKHIKSTDISLCRAWFVRKTAIPDSPCKTCAMGAVWCLMNDKKPSDLYELIGQRELDGTFDPCEMEKWIKLNGIGCLWMDDGETSVRPITYILMDLFDSDGRTPDGLAAFLESKLANNELFLIKEA